MAGKYNPDLHHRRSLRLKGYDYSQSGVYFVTVCTQNRECLFGEIEDGKIRANDAGQMIQLVWDELPQHYPGVDVDAFVVMPNHIHGIIVLDARANLCAGPSPPGQPRGVAPTMSLPAIVHRFKSLTTARYRHGATRCNWRPFPGRLWQRNYYEHVIRNEDELRFTREYIANNPTCWADDENNPDRPT